MSEERVNIQTEDKPEKSRGRPPVTYALSAGDTARQMVFSVREASATTRQVSSGSSPLSTHSTEA